ncbi:MAG: hypothetical protein ABJC26_11675 [Gemmatimonadaceae bacterium]
MRNPKKRRDVSAIFVLIGIAAFAITMALFRGEPAAHDSWLGSVVLSFFVTLIATVGLVVFQGHYRRREKLLNGYKHLAKWTVSPADLALFRENEKKHNAVGRGNALKIRKESNSTGFDVIVSQESIMVDDDFYGFVDRRGLQWLPDVPPSLEFNMVTASKNGSVRWNIRLPVPANAEAGARTVWDYFNRPQLAPNLAKRYQSMKKFGVVCTLFSAPVMLFAVKFLGNESMKSAALASLIVGFVGMTTGISTFVVAHVLLRKSKTGTN